MKRFCRIAAMALAIAVIACEALAGPLARIYITPGHISLHRGVQQKFTVIGTDALDNIVPVTEPITWSVQIGAGSITQDGVFTPGASAGWFVNGVKATTSSGLKGTAVVTISSSAPVNGYVFERSWGDYVPGSVLSPRGIDIDTNGDVIVSDPMAQSVQRFDSIGRYISQLGPGLSLSNCLNGCDAVVVSGGYTYVTGTSSISKFDSLGRLVTVWDYYATPGMFYTDALAADSSGNLYALDIYNAVVAKISSSTGAILMKFGSKGSLDGQLQAPRGLCVDSSGNIYIADEGNQRVDKFDSNGNFLQKWSIDEPYGITIDASGIVYVLSWYDFVAKLDTATSTITRMKFNVSIFHSWNIGVDPSGNIYLLQDTNYPDYTRSVLKFDPQGNLIARWGGVAQGKLGNASSISIGPDNRICTTDRENTVVQVYDLIGNYVRRQKIGDITRQAAPYRAKCDAQGNMYATGLGVSKYDASGNLLKWFDLPTVDGNFNDADGIALAANGDIYLTGATYPGLIRLDSSGNVISALYASANTAYNLTSICIDSLGNILGSNQSGYVRKFSPTGTLLSQFSTGGYRTKGICSAPDGSVFVTNEWPNNVQRYSPTGTLLATWGSEGNSLDQFAAPQDIALDQTGNFYVADYLNMRIVKYMPLQTSISKIKDLPDGSFVALSDMVVTAAYNEVGAFSYIESLDRAAGIRVSSLGSARGARVSITGTLSTVDGERVITVMSSSYISDQTLAPVGMTNKSLGGADLNYDSATGAGQRGVEDGVGANNIGLLVTTTGKVTGVGSDYFYIDDGTHARDGSIFVGVRVSCRTLSKPARGAYATVTGISRINKIGTRYFRSISPRIQGDIVINP